MSNPFTGKASSSEDFPLVEAGNHPAVIVALIDLGTHDEEFQGTPRVARKVLVVWELSDGHIGAEYTLSFHKKGSLRKLIEAIRGRAYGDSEEIDFMKMVGRPCLLQIEHKTSSGGSVYAKVTACSQLVKGMAPPTPRVKPVIWFLGSPEQIPAQDWIPHTFLEGKKKPIADVIAASHEMKPKKEFESSANGNGHQVPATVGAGAGPREEEIPW